MRAADEASDDVSSPLAGVPSSASPVTSSPVSRCAGRSSVSVIRRPLLRNAYCWNRARRVSKSYSVVSKIPGSAQNVCVVPVSSDGSSRSTGATGLPPSVNSWRQEYPSRRTSDTMRVDSALTTDMPTPWRPPETA